MDQLRELYLQLILDHNQNPKNFRKINNCNIHKTGNNPLCGDQLDVFINIEDNFISDISFLGSGCAISKASASIMTEILRGKTINEAFGLFNKFRDMAMTGNSVDNLPFKLSVLSGIYKYPSRVKCALLAWHTMYKSFDKNNKSNVSTEGLDDR